jgi:lipoprotein-releasing system permease protein
MVARVAGTFRTDAYPQDAQRVYAEIADVRRLMDAAGETSWVEVRLADFRQLETRKREIQSRLGPDWLVVDLLEQNRDILRALNTEKLILFLAIGLIVVVASLNVVSMLILMVHDKVREIGALTAMGARARGIASVFVLQGLFIGVVGSVAGVALGALASWWLDAYQIIQLDPDVYFISHVPFRTRLVDVVAVAILAGGVSLTATIYPAWKAASGGGHPP